LENCVTKERYLQREAEAAAALKTALEGVLDPDDDRLLLDTLEGETELLEAIDTAMAQIADDVALAEATQRQIAQLIARKAWCEGRVDRMKDALKSVLEQFPEVSGARRPYGTIYIGRAAATADIYDEAQLPDEFKRIPPTPKSVPNRAKILQALRDGEIVPGARLMEGTTFLGVRK
jgi:Siphovirus Gp157